METEKGFVQVLQKPRLIRNKLMWTKGRVVMVKEEMFYFSVIKLMLICLARLPIMPMEDTNGSIVTLSRT